MRGRDIFTSKFLLRLFTTYSQAPNKIDNVAVRLVKLEAISAQVVSFLDALSWFWSAPI